ncbi:MAG: hypothetical protein AAFY08_15650 [Planctomycetota bacterium]
MTNTARIVVLQERLTRVQAAIDGTLDRNAASYMIHGRRLDSFSPVELVRLETRTLNEINRLQRGSRFGGVRFSRPGTASGGGVEGGTCVRCGC